MADILDLLQTEASIFMKGPADPRTLNRSFSLKDVVDVIVAAVLTRDTAETARTAQPKIAGVSTNAFAATSVPFSVPDTVLTPPGSPDQIQSIVISQPQSMELNARENTDALPPIDMTAAEPLPELEDLFGSSPFGAAFGLGALAIDQPDIVGESTLGPLYESLTATPMDADTRSVDPVLLASTSPAAILHPQQKSCKTQETDTTIPRRRSTGRVSRGCVSKSSPTQSSLSSSRRTRSLGKQDTTPTTTKYRGSAEQKKKENHRIVEKRYRRRVQTQLERLGTLVPERGTEDNARTSGNESDREDRSSKVCILKDACAYITQLKNHAASLDSQIRNLKEQINKMGAFC